MSTAITTPAMLQTSDTVRGVWRYRCRASRTDSTIPTETGSARLNEGNAVTRTWPGNALAAVEGMALRPSGNSTTSSIRANGPRRANGKIVGTATMTTPASIESGRRSPLRPRAAKSASAASGHAVNFMADAIPSTTPEANGRRRWASTMASNKTATHGYVVPAGGQRQGRQGQDHERLQCADLSPLVRPTEVEGHRGHSERGQAEEDPSVAQTVVGPDLARDAQDGHDREVGQEPCVVGLPGGVVLDRVVGLDEGVVRILPPDEILTPDLHRHDLGLQVRTGDSVEPPQDLESQRDGERAGEHADGHQDAGQPRTVVPEPRQPAVRLPSAGAAQHPGQDGRRERAEDEGRQRHAPPHLVQGVGRGVDRAECEERADAVEQRVTHLRRDVLDPVDGPPPCVGGGAAPTRDGGH